MRKLLYIPAVWLALYALITSISLGWDVLVFQFKHLIEHWLDYLLTILAVFGASVLAAFAKD